MSFNKITLMGRLTKDVDFNTTTNGVSVARFSLAVNRQFKNANGENEVDFLDIVAWRNLADFSKKWLQKGRNVLVCGSLQTRTYQANDGTHRRVYEIVAEQIEFADSAKTENTEEPKSKKVDLEEIMIDEDMPF